MFEFIRSVLIKTAGLLTASILTISNLFWTKNAIILSDKSAYRLSNFTFENLVITAPPAAPKENQNTPETQDKISPPQPLDAPEPSNNIKQFSAAPKTIPQSNIPQSNAASSPKTLAPEQFLNRTQIILRQRLNGSYWPELQTTLTDLGIPNLKWDPLDRTIGGNGPLAKMEPSFACSPEYKEEAKTIYSAIVFKIKTAYECELKLKEADGKIASKKFNFQTGPGLLQISEGGISTNNLRSQSTASIRFVNTDDEPIIIENLFFDMETSAVNILEPAAIRFEDIDNKVLDKYFLEDILIAESKPHSFSVKNAAANLSLKIEPHSAKVIFIQIININYQYVERDPTINLAINKINTNRRDMSYFSLPVKKSWTCVTKYLQDNPEAMCR